MKKIFIGMAAGAAALVSFAGTANAAARQSINQREARLEMQIRNGVHSGRLNRAEIARLTVQLNEIERIERKFRRNGLTFAERRVLNQRLDALAQDVRHQLNDPQVAFGRGYHRI